MYLMLVFPLITQRSSCAWYCTNTYTDSLYSYDKAKVLQNWSHLGFGSHGTTSEGVQLWH